jgi:anti-sigma factor ChrR (cupin superfamily)
VATPVAGFRDLSPPVVVADRGVFPAAVTTALASATAPGGPVRADDAAVATWHHRAEAMMALMDRVRAKGRSS